MTDNQIFFLPLDICRCSNDNCEKKLKCARHLDVLPFETYSYSEFNEKECDKFIKKEL